MFGMYLELAKARLSALVLVTTLAGFLLATRGGVATSAGSATWWQPGLGWSWWADLIWTLLGTGLAAAGANALNQWYEPGGGRFPPDD
jgi:heme O synthase-like polyprenyltransferase